MTNEIQNLQVTLNSLVEEGQVPFWRHLDFWISSILGVVGIVVGAFGVYYAWKAFVEAGAAKRAARLAGKMVKFQSVAIELREFKLGALEENIRFSEARDRLTEATKNLHQILSAFESEKQFEAKIARLWDVLHKTRESLNCVKPKDAKAESEAPQAIYNAIEGPFAEINELVGDLTGLFEKKTTNDFGDNNATD